MNPFVYRKAATSAEATQAVSSSGSARFIAGGTNILDLMKVNVESPQLLVDINALPLRGVEIRGDMLYLGALARMSHVARDPHVRARLPFVASALDQSASPQLRNMASMGGNLLQRTRCPYYRDVATRCNKREPGSGCDALQGVNRMQAVLGTSDSCIATHPSDVAVPLVALGAAIHISRQGGDRVVPLPELYRLPGNTPHIETTLKPGELITELVIPLVPFAARSSYLKVRDRSQYEFALASAAVALDLDGGQIRAARIALGGVATIPWRSLEAESILTSGPANRALFQRAAEAAFAGARGYGQNDFKISLGKRTLVRALEQTMELA